MCVLCSPLLDGISARHVTSSSCSTAADLQTISKDNNSKDMQDNDDRKEVRVVRYRMAAGSDPFYFGLRIQQVISYTLVVHYRKEIMPNKYEGQRRQKEFFRARKSYWYTRVYVHSCRPFTKYYTWRYGMKIIA